MTTIQALDIEMSSQERQHQLLSWFQGIKQELNQDEVVFLFIPVLLPIAILITFLHKQRSKNQPKLPPSPSKLPIIGNLHQLGTFPHHSLHWLSQKHGPFMLFHMGQVPTLVVSSRAGAEEIMKTHDLIFSSRPSSYITKKLLYDLDMAFAPYGEYWRQIRKICIVELLSPKRMESFGCVREEEVSNMVEKITISSSSALGPINLTELLVCFTNDVVCRVALGRKYSQESEGGKRFKRMLGEFVELLGSFYVGDLIPCLAGVCRWTGLVERTENNSREWDELLEGIVNEHEERLRSLMDGVDHESDHKDFVDVLLHVQKEVIFTFPFTKDSIKALILDVFAAGTDTTYTVIEWTMSELLNHPQVMTKVKAEVRNIAIGKSLVTEDMLPQLNYLKAVIKESMRLHPPLPLLVPRESTQTIKIQDYEIPAKTRVIVNAWSIARDPQVWEEPDKFNPERFMDGGSKSHIDFKGHDFELIPFGAGRRGSPGIHFATSTFELALANLLYKFDWKVSNEGRLDMAQAPALTIHRKTPLLLHATPYATRP